MMQNVPPNPLASWSAAAIPSAGATPLSNVTRLPKVMGDASEQQPSKELIQFSIDDLRFTRPKPPD
jgi:hypothetical protein